MSATAMIRILKEVAQWGPLIAEAGKKIYDNTLGMFGVGDPSKRTATAATVQELNRQIARLEQNDLEQTKLAADMARQMDNLSKLVHGLAARLRLALIAAALALALAIFLLIRALF
jgi:ribosomal 50S subunit-associated protein YjgA (DUF615 family)